MSGALGLSARGPEALSINGERGMAVNRPTVRRCAGSTQRQADLRPTLPAYRLSEAIESVWVRRSMGSPSSVEFII